MMQTQRQFWRGSMVLLGCNTLAGILNYAFQVMAARRLGVADYGSLNLWIADVTVALSVGTVAQMVANYFPMPPRSLRKFAYFAITLAILASTLICFVADKGLADGLFAGGMAVGLGLISGWLGGQVQARLLFGLLGGALVAGASLKLLVGGLGAFQGPLTNYYVAVSASFIAPILLIGGMSIAHPLGPMAEAREQQVKVKVICACLLAMATALIPQLDIINLRQFQSSEVLGQYARVMLAAKAIFFGAAAILQVALPFHLRAQDANLNQSASGAIRKAELTVVAACFVASGCAALFLPWLSPMLFGFELADFQGWILLTGVIASMQFALLQVIQRDCAKLAWVRAGKVLLAVGAVLIVGVFSPSLTVGTYLTAVAIYYAVILALRMRTRA